MSLMLNARPYYNVSNEDFLKKGKTERLSNWAIQRYNAMIEFYYGCKEIHSLAKFAASVEIDYWHTDTRSNQDTSCTTYLDAQAIEQFEKDMKSGKKMVLFSSAKNEPPSMFNIVIPIPKKMPLSGETITNTESKFWENPEGFTTHEIAHNVAIANIFKIFNILLGKYLLPRGRWIRSVYDNVRPHEKFVKLKNEVMNNYY